MAIISGSKTYILAQKFDPNIGPKIWTKTMVLKLKSYSDKFKTTFREASVQIR